MFFVYVLKSDSIDKRYVGCTADVVRRLSIMLGYHTGLGVDDHGFWFIKKHFPRELMPCTGNGVTSQAQVERNWIAFFQVDRVRCA